jgi:hypothetical protein
MSATAFAHVGIVEVLVLALGIAVAKSWRRLGAARVLSAMALLLVLSELAVIVVTGHPTEATQTLAFFAIAAFGWRISIDDQAKQALVPPRTRRRLARLGRR